MSSRSSNPPGTRFMPLLSRARAVEQQAMQALSQAQQRLQHEQNKLQQLQSYGQTSRPAAQQMPAAMANRHAFLCRLREAIQMQERQLARAEQGIVQARQRWMHANGDTRLYEQLIATEQQRARQTAARREQKELDEIAQRRHQAAHHGA